MMDASILKHMAIQISKSQVSESNICGMKQNFARLLQIIVLPIKFKQLLCNFKKSYSIIYGDCGLGKSYLVKAIANQANATLITVDLSIIAFQEDEQNCIVVIQQIFELAKKLKPCILLFSGFQFIEQDLQINRKIKIELSQQLPKIVSDLQIQCLLEATSLGPIGYFFRRRAMYKIEFKYPEQGQRLQLIERELGSIDHSLSNEQMIDVSRMMDGLSYSQIKQVIRMVNKNRERNRIDEFGPRMKIESERELNFEDFSFLRKIDI